MPSYTCTWVVEGRSKDERKTGERTVEADNPIAVERQVKQDLAALMHVRESAVSVYGIVKK